MLMLTSSELDLLQTKWPDDTVPATAERLALLDSLASEMRCAVARCEVRGGRSR